MASYHHLLQQSKSRIESPAKVFAKLKSKVRREGICATDEGFTVRDTLCNIRGKHGAEFKSPMKGAMNTWMTDGTFHNETRALNLSPISTPHRNLGYSYSDKPEHDVGLTARGHGCTPRKAAFLESTAVSQPRYLVSRKEIHQEPPYLRVLDTFNETNRSPVKAHTLDEQECDPNSIFSPMRRRLRKRKLEPWGVNKDTNSTKINSEDLYQLQNRKTFRASSAGDAYNNSCMEDLARVRVFSAALPDKNQVTREPMFPPPRPFCIKRCKVIAEKIPMSPAKVFAYMKQRESKAEQQEAHNVNKTTRDLFGQGHSRQSQDTLSTAHTSDTEDTALAESVVPPNRSRVESDDSQSHTGPLDDVFIPAAPPQPVLLEDPLIFNSPRISIPKKDKPVFKRNNWPQPTKFPSESVIHLKKWFLRRNLKGLFVDGIHKEDNIPWNSNIIVDRVSNFVVKTISGRVYILDGKMNLQIDPGIPTWFLKKFVNGFPPNWKELYENLLSESKDGETERTSIKRDTVAKTKSDTDRQTTTSVSLSVKRQRNNLLQSPDMSHLDASSSSAKTSRSGRVLKRPLEYWKGGRVILDAQMNVTIHECYDTSICNPEVTTTVSARATHKPARMFLPHAEGGTQSDSASDKEAPARKVKAPPHQRNKNKIKRLEKSTSKPESLADLLSSPEECGRRTRSSQRSSSGERPLLVDAVPQKQSRAKRPSARAPKKQTHGAPKAAGRDPRKKKRAVSASPESPAVNDKTSQGPSSNDDVRREKRGNGTHGKKGEKAQPSHLSEEGEEEPRKRAARDGDAAKQKRAKRTTTPQPTAPLSKSKQSGKKRTKTIPQEQDEDEWTEAELMKLKEAVTLYPKHMAGYWLKVAMIVGTRSAEECHSRHTLQGASQTPDRKPKKHRKKKVEAPKEPGHPVISARVGTLRRKNQVREFLETLPKENVEDVFSCAYMQNKRFEIPSMCPSDDFTLSDLEPTTPMSTGLTEAKTPQCLHITPGMMGSPNRSHDDKYVYQLQQRMKKNQFDVCKNPSKSFTPTPSVKRSMRRCSNTENETFVVWEMFKGNDEAAPESDEDEDFYFSDSD